MCSFQSSRPWQRVRRERLADQVDSHTIEEAPPPSASAGVAALEIEMRERIVEDVHKHVLCVLCRNVFPVQGQLLQFILASRALSGTGSPSAEFVFHDNAASPASAA